MFVVSSVLMLIALIYFLVWEPKRRGKAVVVAVAGLGVGYYAAEQTVLKNPPGHTEVFRGNSNFGLLQVIDMEPPGLRMYLNDRLTQNTYLLKDRRSASLFTYMLKGLAQVYTPEIKDVLCIGMGVGVVPMQFADMGARVDVVEINDAIVPVAQKYFNFEATKVRLTVGDGRQFLATTTNRYDTIILDAFLGESVPAHLMSREALTAMRQRLKPGGTLVMNTIAETTVGRDYFVNSLTRTLHGVFSEVKVHMASEGGFGNIFLVAGDRAGLGMLRAPDMGGIPPFLVPQVESAYAGLRLQDPKRGDVLTDDFNPVDFHDAGTRERFRQMLVSSAKNRGH